VLPAYAQIVEIAATLQPHPGDGKHPMPQKPRARGESMAARKGKGAGWGGQAKGAGAERYVFDEAGPGRGHKSIKGEARRVRNERRVEALEQFYWDVARGEALAIDSIRLSAAAMLLNRLAPIVKDQTPPEGVKIMIEGGLPKRPI
jgi:hypothetical protein